jgi:hypothetical protein
VVVARRRSGEGKIVARGRKFGRRRRLCFKGERWGGGSGGVGAAWRRSGRERGRGGPECDGDNTAARRRVAAARTGGDIAHATVKGGGVGATQNGVGDRWAGM